mmetsp:Transcript_59505/g.166775  ORF Transcript_59505/g.166775 Transcript_59505/m.166775 type:complete len:223 (+) Transcript_59505:135-803(+)
MRSARNKNRKRTRNPRRNGRRRNVNASKRRNRRNSAWRKRENARKSYGRNAKRRRQKNVRKGNVSWQSSVRKKKKSVNGFLRSRSWSSSNAKNKGRKKCRSANNSKKALLPLAVSLQRRRRESKMRQSQAKVRLERRVLVRAREQVLDLCIPPGKLRQSRRRLLPVPVSLPPLLLRPSRQEKIVDGKLKLLCPQRHTHQSPSRPRQNPLVAVYLVLRIHLIS